MNTQALGSTVLWMQNIMFFVLSVILPFRYVLRTGRFRRGVCLVWGTAALLSFCSVAAGEFLRRSVDKGFAAYFLEGPQFLAFALMGWWPGVIVAGAAYLIFLRRKHVAKQQESVRHEAAA